jgi:hypothetical protein
MEKIVDCKELGKLFKLYVFLLFLVFINSMYPWFFCISHINVVVSFVCGLFAVIVLIYYRLYDCQIHVFLFLFAIMLFAWEYHSCNVFGFSEGLFMLLSWLPLLFLGPHQNMCILNFITTWFARLLILSIIGYIFFLIGISPISPTKINYLDHQYELFNYYLFVIPQKANIYDEFIRFRGVFLEPGHMAMGVTTLLFANNFDLKNKNVLILFIANLFSFSLAAYIVMTVGYLMLNVNLKGVVKIFLGCAFALCFCGVMYYTGHGTILDQLILKRLAYSESTGTIEGNNRTTFVYESVYRNTISKPGTLILGDSENALLYKSVSGAGIKKYIVEKGLIGVFFVLLFYLYMCFYARNRNSFVLSIVILLMLYQNAYPMWSCVCISYILGNSNYNKKLLIN